MLTNKDDSSVDNTPPQKGIRVADVVFCLVIFLLFFLPMKCAFAYPNAVFEVVGAKP